MLALMLCGGVAGAGPAVDYIDMQMGVEYQLETLYLHYTAGAVQARAAGGGETLSLAQSKVHGLFGVAQHLEPWSGDDEGLHAALMQRAEHSVLFFDQTLPTMVELLGGPHPRDADQLQFETLVHLSKVTDIQDTERLNASLHAFGNANRVRIHDDPPLALGVPTLELDLPGPASALSSSVRVTFAISHHNEMLGFNDQVLSVWNGLVELEPPAVQGERMLLERAVQELREVPPWMGDSTLTAAMSANGEALLDLVDLLVQSAELDMRLFLFGKKRRQRDSLLEEVENSVPILNASVRSAQTTFRDAWQVGAYEQHNDELARWAATLGEGL